MKTLWSTLAFIAEEKLKHGYCNSWILFCLADLRSGTVTLTLFGLIQFTWKLQANSAAQPCLCRWIYVHITPYISAFFKPDLKSKWHYVLKQWKYISISVIWLLKRVLKPLSIFLLLYCALEQMCSVSYYLGFSDQHLISIFWTRALLFFSSLPFCKNLNRDNLDHRVTNFPDIFNPKQQWRQKILTGNLRCLNYLHI